jgi:hypothetical protein
MPVRALRWSLIEHPPWTAPPTAPDTGTGSGGLSAHVLQRGSYISTMTVSPNETTPPMAKMYPVRVARVNDALVSSCGRIAPQTAATTTLVLATDMGAAANHRPYLLSNLSTLAVAEPAEVTPPTANRFVPRATKPCE